MAGKMIRSKEFVVSNQKATFLQHPKRDVTCVDVAQAQSLIATGQQDGKIYLWDSSEATILMILEGGHEGQVNQITFNEAVSLVSCGEDGQLLLWDLQKRAGFRKLAGHGGAAILTCKFSPDASLLASGARDNDVMVWGNLGRPVCGRLRSHTAWVSSVVFTSDSKKLVSGGYDNLITIWSMETFTSVKTIRYTRAPITALSVSVEGSVIAAGTDNGLLFYFRTSDATCLRILRGHTDEITAIHFVEEMGVVVSSSRDTSVKVWDITGRCLKSFRAHEGSILGCAATKDFIVTTGIDSTARVVTYGWVDKSLGDDDEDDDY